MRKVQDQASADSRNESSDGDVHYEGVALIGAHTLCGHTDMTGSDFQEVRKRVTCHACIAVRDHVLGR